MIIVLAGALFDATALGQEPHPRIRLKPVESTDLSKVGYNRSTRVLKVQFHDGRLYEFYGVSDSVHKHLMTAPSKGRFFHDKIQNRFEYRRIGD